MYVCLYIFKFKRNLIAAKFFFSQRAGLKSLHAGFIEDRPMKILYVIPATMPAVKKYEDEVMGYYLCFFSKTPKEKSIAKIYCRFIEY